MDWGTVVAVLVAMAIFMGAVMVIFGTGGMLIMQAMFRKTAEALRCPIPGCLFAKGIGDALYEIEREEPMGESPHEAEREIITARLASDAR